MGEISEEAAVAPPHPEGEYAIVEVLGHRTIVGRIAEVERFGTKFLAVEPIWQGELLPAALVGGASIYQLTPCSAATAFQRQAKRRYELPPSIGVIAPEPKLEFAPAFLEPAATSRAPFADDCDDDEMF